MKTAEAHALLLKWSRRGESNSRPADYESAALPLSHAGNKIIT